MSDTPNPDHDTGHKRGLYPAVTADTDACACCGRTLSADSASARAVTSWHVFCLACVRNGEAKRLVDSDAHLRAAKTQTRAGDL